MSPANMSGMDRLVERFLSYIAIDTSSDPASDRIPSTAGQLTLGKKLLEELSRLGVRAQMDKNGIVYGHLPANSRKSGLPAIGFVAHMDTPPGLNSRGIRLRFIKNYDGSPIILHEKNQLILAPEQDPFLPGLIGHDLITTDGTTILGADDKAGIAELVTMLDILVHNPGFAHGPVYTAFSVDEEIGRGMACFDPELFPCDFAYTVDIDGNDISCLDYETFCGGWTEVNVLGRPMHPGTGAGILRNACTMAMELHCSLPLRLDPYYSREYEGIIHLAAFTGRPEHAHMRYRVCSFEENVLWEQMHQIERAAKALNTAYGFPAFSVSMRQSSSNIKTCVMRDPRCLEYAKRAMAAAGLLVKHRPIRGGTDGIPLAERGIPAPNLNNGSYHALSFQEMVSVTQMKQCVEIFLKIVSADAPLSPAFLMIR